MSLEGFAVARVDLGYFDRVRLALHKVDLREAWKQARKPIRADLKEHRDRESGPDGTWPGRAASTRERAAQGRRMPRKMLGRLPGAFKTKAERARFLITWRTGWADAQRRGGTVGHGAKLPARDWAYISDRATKVIAEIIAKGLAYLIEAT